jgi:CBS domain-containing protein
MKVQDVMTRDVRACRPDTNLAEAVRDMWEVDCGVLPVVGDDGHVIGLITDRDICVAIATKGRTADRVAVREVAHDHVYTCLEADATTTALRTMQEQ